MKLQGFIVLVILGVASCAEFSELLQEIKNLRSQKTVATEESKKNVDYVRFEKHKHLKEMKESAPVKSTNNLKKISKAESAAMNRKSAAFSWDVKGWRDDPPCNGEAAYYTEEYTTVTSPRYNGVRKYNKNAYCEYVFDAPPNKGLVFEFDDFRVEDEADCLYDSLCFEDFNNGDQLGCYCGNLNTLTVETTSRSVIMRWYTDGSEQKKGWSMYFYFFDTSDGSFSGSGFDDYSGWGSGYGGETFTDCGGSYSGDSGYVSMSPVPYPNHAICVYEISVPQDKRVNLRFEHMDIEDDSTCSYDQLIVLENNVLIDDFCGTRLPGDIRSSGNTITIVFASDFSIQGSGFTIHYTAVDGGQSNGGDPQIPSGAGPSLNTSCGNPAISPRGIFSRIVGGDEAAPGSWPWQIELKYRGNQHCGGSIVSNRYIVTAAHCTHDDPRPRRYEVVAGEHNRFINEGHEQAITVESIVEHPNYDPRTTDNDIAILKLSRPLEFGDRVSPICLPSGNDPRPGQMCVTTGWGATQGTGSDEVLRQVKVPFLPFDDCQEYYDGVLTDAMFCAGYPEGEKDSCQGDSGGPLVCQDTTGYWALFGVTSWGYGCADAGHPGVYSRVTRLRSFIDANTSDAPWL